MAPLDAARAAPGLAGGDPENIERLGGRLEAMQADVFAKSPLERLNWLAQVQGDSLMTETDVATAVILARFIHSKAGFAARSGEVFARLLKISRRAWVERVGRLASRGHVLVRRQQRLPARIYAILWPACGNDFEAQRGCTSERKQDEKPCFTSEPAFDGKRGRASGDEKRCCTSNNGLDEKRQRALMRSAETASNGDQSNSGSLSRDNTGEMVACTEDHEHESGGFSACAAEEFLPEFLGPSDADEPLVTEVAPWGVPPPIEPRGLELIAAVERSKCEPSGWRDFVAETLDDAAAHAVNLP